MGKKKKHHHHSFTEVSRAEHRHTTGRGVFVAQISQPQEGDGDLYFDIGMGGGVVHDAKGHRFAVREKGLYRVEVIGTVSSPMEGRYIISFVTKGIDLETLPLTITPIYVREGGTSAVVAATYMSLYPDYPLTIRGEGGVTILPGFRLLISQQS